MMTSWHPRHTRMSPIGSPPAFRLPMMTFESMTRGPTLSPLKPPPRHRLCATMEYLSWSRAPMPKRVATVLPLPGLTRTLLVMMNCCGALPWAQSSLFTFDPVGSKSMTPRRAGTTRLLSMTTLAVAALDPDPGAVGVVDEVVVDQHLVGEGPGGRRRGAVPAALGQGLAQRERPGDLGVHRERAGALAHRVAHVRVGQRARAVGDALERRGGVPDNRVAEVVEARRPSCRRCARCRRRRLLGRTCTRSTRP